MNQGKSSTRKATQKSTTPALAGGAREERSHDVRINKGDNDGK